MEEGFRTGLYKGYQFSLASSYFRSAVSLPLFDFFKSRRESMPKQNPFVQNYIDKIGVSLLSSLLISTLTYPLDTMKRFMQLSGAKGHTNPYANAQECFTKSIKTIGVAGLYRGMHLYFMKEFLTAFM